jgi:pyruvate-formate lyase
MSVSSTAKTDQALLADRMARFDRMRNWFTAMLTETKVEITGADTLLVGPKKLEPEKAAEMFPDGYGADNYHYPMGLKQLMELGLPGIAAKARATADTLDDDSVDKHYLLAIAGAYDAACDFVRRWADAATDAADAATGDERLRLNTIAGVCRSLSENAPQTFHEAVQLFWFAFPMRNGAITSPPGRMDIHLYPPYKAEEDRGELDAAQAQQLIDELFVKMDTVWTGDGLMNVVLAGQMPDGSDAVNAVSYMMVDTASRLPIANPQLNIRFHYGTPKEFRQKVADLQVGRTGGCTILNDELVVPAFIAEGIPADLARNYSCDGCNELQFDGEGLIAFSLTEAAKALEVVLFNGEENPLFKTFTPQAAYHYIDEVTDIHSGFRYGLRTGEFAEMTSFDQVFEAYMAQYFHQLSETIAGFADSVLEGNRNASLDLFLAGTFERCLETGLDPMRGGTRIHSYMIFSGSIPTAADSLAAIKRLVFDDKVCTAGELLQAIRDNWDGHENLRKLALAAPKFGNDDAYVDEITAEIVRRFDTYVRGFKHELDYPIWPALFCHTFNLISAYVGATPDGRRQGDPVAEHFSPVPGRAVSGPTAVINSMARSPINRMVGTAVTHVSLSRMAIGEGTKAAELMHSLVDSAMRMGLLCINFPVYDVEQMRAAQENPEQHADLIVRVWGYSEKFTMLDRRLQDHIIQRAIKMQS